jgi:hypothetical protein
VDRRFWIAFAFCLIASVIPFVATERLPMTDLAEHAAQVAILKHFDDPCQEFHRNFEINWRTPYLGGYLAIRLLAAVMDVESAVKLAIWATVVLLPLALRFLLIRSGGDPWLALLGFPLAFGYSFYWGFFNFSMAVPLVLVCVALLLGPAPRAWLLTAMGLLLLVCHALAIVFCTGVALLVALIERAPRKVVPFVPAVLALGFWVLQVRSTVESVNDRAVWHSGLHRVWQLPALLFSNAPDTAATAMSAVIVLALMLARPRVSRDPRRWTLFAAGALLYFGAPLYAFGTAFLSGRFAVFVMAGLLLVLEHPARPQLARVAVTVAVVTWMIVLGARFRRFDSEAEGFDGILARIPSARRVAAYYLDPYSEHVPGPVYLHFGAYYQVRKGGVVAGSFAASFPVPVRYREGAEPRLRGRSVLRGGPVDWSGLEQFDYVILRGRDPRPFLASAPVSLRILAREGAWWLFAMPARSTEARSCAPLEN